MPKGFSDKEKERIRDKLIDAGREIFGLYGFKKASIDEAVQRTGISKGAFYLFFASKELYFFEVMEAIEQKFRAALLPVINDKSLAPEKRFKMYFLKSLEFMEQNPILAKIRGQELEALMLNLPPEKINKHMDSDMDYLLQFLKQLRREAGLSEPLPEKAWSGFVYTLFYTFLHKDELGEEKYRQGTELLLDMAAHYLFHNKTS